MSVRVYLVEDDEKIVRMLKRHCAARGWDLAHGLGDGLLPALASFNPDILLVDWNLPTVSGLDLIAQVRAAGFRQLPILAVTGRTRDEDQVACLTQGADAFLAKPFSVALLEAHIQGFLRRREWADESFKDEHLEFSLSQRRLLVRGEERKLSPLEWTLLSTLFQSPGALRREVLVEALWGCSDCAKVSALEKLVSRLRLKVERNPKRPAYVRSERGLGYRFSVEARQ